MKIAAVISIVTLLAFLASCGDEASTGPQTPSDVPYRDEAEVIALFYSGELRAPEALTRRVGLELRSIRSQWSDSIPEVDIGFLAPWAVSHLHMRFDDTAFLNVLDSQNTEWNELCNSLEVEYYEYLPGLSTWVAVWSETKMNPLLLGEYFVGFPGVNYIHSAERSHPYGPHFVRFEDEGTGKYFFKTTCSPDLYHTYYYFAVEHGAANSKGRHAECYEDADSLFDNLPWDSVYPILEAYQDSVELARPLWVDTARNHIRILELSDQFSWSRP
jgi:hypothetical protein